MQVYSRDVIARIFLMIRESHSDLGGNQSSLKELAVFPRDTELVRKEEIKR